MCFIYYDVLESLTTRVPSIPQVDMVHGSLSRQVLEECIKYADENLLPEVIASALEIGDDSIHVAYNYIKTMLSIPRFGELIRLGVWGLKR
jgi:hypothetical protein